MNPIWLLLASLGLAPQVVPPTQRDAPPPVKDVVKDPPKEPLKVPSAADAKKLEGKDADASKDDAKKSEDAQKKAVVLDHLIDQLDINRVVAVANGEVVTMRDMLLDYKLSGRGLSDPDRGAAPTEKEAREIEKSLVMSRLWLAHARLWPMFADIASSQEIDDIAKEIYGPLFGEPSLTEDEKKLIRRHAEEVLAQLFVLQSDPEYRRASNARPSDVELWWDQRKEFHRSPTRATLGRVLLGRDLYGSKVDDLAKEIRRLALEKGSLEAAARELAPGSYSEPKELKEIALEGEVPGLREEVVTFAKTSQPGELSAPLSGQSTVMIFSLLEHKEGHDVSFEDAAPKIKEYLENRGKQGRTREYFATKILPGASYAPGDLFDEELELFFGKAPKPQPPATKKPPQAAANGK